MQMLGLGMRDFEYRRRQDESAKAAAPEAV
jgi:hypothetical protein